MIQQWLNMVVEGENLTRDDAVDAMNAIMSGECTDAQIGAFLVALRMKGETVEEIAGFAQVMRDKATNVRPGPSEHSVVDTCGTGGDRKNTFNISTAAALVTAGAGVTVAKHGNRSVSSRSGSADVLAALGVNIEAGIPAVERCLREAKVGFLFAPMMHAAMKYAIAPRREIAIRTVFNILGPLTNPAKARCQVMGVYRKELAPLMANVLKSLGSERCFVVHGYDGMDEITITDRTRVAELANGQVREFDLSPEDFGMEAAPLSDLLVDTPEESAGAIREILEGARGARRDIVLLNAAAAVLASGAAADWPDALQRAGESIDSGRAKAALETMARIASEG